MPPLSEKQRVDLRSLIDKNGLNMFADRIERKAQSAIHLIRADVDDYSEVGATRFGGDPDLPASIDWPSFEGIYMTFVAQINVGTLPSLPASPLPDSGWLYVFLMEDYSWSILPHEVIYLADSTVDLKRTRSPEPRARIELTWTGAEHYVPHRVTIRSAISLPREDVLAANEEEIVEDADADRYFSLQEDVRGQPVSSIGVSQLLGWHEDLGSNPTRQAVLHKHGLDSIRYTYSLASLEANLNDALRTGNNALADIYSREKEDFERFLTNEEALTAEMYEWQLLLELDSDYDINMCWGDAGKVQFMINRNDLARLDFSKTYADILSS